MTASKNGTCKQSPLSNSLIRQIRADEQKVSAFLHYFASTEGSKLRAGWSRPVRAATSARHDLSSSAHMTSLKLHYLRPTRDVSVSVPKHFHFLKIFLHFSRPSAGLLATTLMTQVTSYDIETRNEHFLLHKDYEMELFHRLVGEVGGGTHTLEQHSLGNVPESPPWRGLDRPPTLSDHPQCYAEFSLMLKRGN
jgi:hypothetical protein